jgi:lysozyme family protein
MLKIPSAHDRTFIPYPLGYDRQFEKSLPNTEIQEGQIKWTSGPMPAKDFSNDLHDPGGKTGEGIEQKEYDLKRRQWGLKTQDILKMSKDEERTIYYTDYWSPYCQKLPAGLNGEFFDTNVNTGQHEAVKCLQQSIGGIDIDGDFGDETAMALNEIVERGGNSVIALMERYKVDREAYYKKLSTFRYFGSDWIRRSETVEKEDEVIAKSSGVDQST